MVNYAEGKIYKIECLGTNKIYFGSTCEPKISRRLAGYTGLYRKYLEGINPVKSLVFDVLENGNYIISLVEKYPCTCKDELKAREIYYISNNECINKKSNLDKIEMI